MSTNPTPGSATRLVVVSGLSGSGKTIALRTLEDLDYYCVDNLPGALLADFVDAVTAGPHGAHPRMAVGMDVRNRPEDLTRLPNSLAELASRGIEYQLIFLDTRDDVLIKRYSDTRRRHPLSAEGLPLADAIALERKLLRPLSAIADRVIDSSDLNVHQLRRLIATELGMNTGALSLLFESFAYKRGVPSDADFVFDARCLPNPHYEQGLAPLTGRDLPVVLFLRNFPEVERLVHDIFTFVSTWLPEYRGDNRNYLTVAVGCTGGRHRSVYIVERLRELLQSRHVLVRHRELG